MENYYKILEVDKNASPEIIEKAYKILVKKYHPDLQKDEEKSISEEKIKKINEAYGVLSDPLKKEAFDKELLNTEVSYEEYNLIVNENMKLKYELNTIKEKLNNFTEIYNNLQNNTVHNNIYNNNKTNNYNKKTNNYNYQPPNIKNTNYQYIYKKNSIFKKLFKLFFSILLTFVIIFIISKIPYFQNVFGILFNSDILLLIIIIVFIIYFNPKR